METEKSSISETKEVPKHKNALAEKYKKQNEDEHQKEVDGYERLKSKESEKLPQPTGWRLLVLPFKMPEKTKGGLYLGADTLARYAGSRIQIDGGEVRLLNDDEVLATIEKPEDILHQY